MSRLSNEEVAVYKIDESAQQTEEILEVLQYFLMSKSVQFILWDISIYNIAHWIEEQWFTKSLHDNKIANDANLVNYVGRQ